MANESGGRLQPGAPNREAGPWFGDVKGLGPMGALQPLGADLNASRKALADALRTLFSALDVSVRRYGARRHLNAATISRYLNGTRMPSSNFITDLLRDAHEHRGIPLTPEAEQRCRELYYAALEAEDHTKHRIQLLRDKLEMADERARQAAIREQVLGDAVQARQSRIADLETQARRLRLFAEAERAETVLELGTVTDERDRLTAECHRLREEVGRLERELTAAHTRTLQAEDQCQILERQLEVVETTTPETDEDDVEQEERLDRVMDEVTRLRQEVRVLRVVAIADPGFPDVRGVAYAVRRHLRAGRPQEARTVLSHAAYRLSVERLVELFGFVRGLGDDSHFDHFGELLTEVCVDTRPDAHLAELHRQLNQASYRAEAALLVRKGHDRQARTR
ncbi:hypothetical protein [Streptomyces sp. SID3343]|uniref:hypothetical protein n=1 Tax=Streptomyces sp. SID3343 TaxID=2690260 RepID=UPI00136EB0E0|nr:hypothetical protein [Streptomyces sp. SID3343]MYV97076.1 hypothetical protein [Streptomyces sp. SID3343]